ncbi:MAG: hypothetical protein ABI579_05815, partial [Candidatus Sumerlaeota bacterium]
MCFRKLSIRAALLALLAMTVSAARADSGFDQQLAKVRELVHGKRVGMMTNNSGVGPDLRQTADMLAEDHGTTIAA